MQSPILHILGYYKEESNGNSPKMNPKSYKYHEALEPLSQPLGITSSYFNC